MDKAQAIHRFWSSFGLPAYDENSVPSGENAPRLPYITYGVIIDTLGGVVSLSASLWYRDSSWETISKKADEISNAIGVGGKVITLDTGYLWICRGTPFAQRMADDTDDVVRRIYLNIQAEFLTAN